MEVSETSLGVLRGLQQYMEEHEFIPTSYELGDYLHYSAQTVTYHLSKLERCGYIRRDRKMSPRIKIIKPA